MTTERPGEPRNEPHTEEREPREKTAAPPVEREHETQEGALEEEEKRKHQRDEPPANPDRT